MAWIVGDGFDYYSASADLGRSVWDALTGTPIIGTPATYPGRFVPGQCLLPAGSSVCVTKTFGTNETTLFACFAYYRPGALSGTVAEGYLEFRDGATAQCTIVLQSNGDLVVKRGDKSGTVVATYAGAFAQDVWTHFQVRILIDPAAGTVHVRKNGATGDTFAATGLNTRNTANTHATAVALGHGAGTPLIRFDDVLIFSGGGAAPNTWVGDVRAICLQPSADTAQKTFAATVATTTEGDSQFITAAIPPNVLHTGGVQTSVAGTGALYPSRGGTVSKVTVTQTGAYTGHVKCAIYADDGLAGAPGTLVATSNELTNPAAGTVDFTFPAGTQLASGRGYFFAFLTDASWTIGTIGVATGHWTVARAYAAGFPAAMPALTPDAVRAPQAKVTLTGSCVAVSELTGNGDTDYVFSSNPGDLDLYDMGDLAVTPTAIVGVVTKAYVKKSDAGARQGQVMLRSGVTDVVSTDAPLSTTYTYVSRVDTVDPATGAAWTLAGVNGIKVGPKVTS